MNTKENRRRENYFEADKLYSLKYVNTQKGTTYIMFDKSIASLVFTSILILPFGLVSLLIGLSDLRRLIYMWMYS